MGLKYLKQRSVNKNFRITLPKEVKDDLYPDRKYDGPDVYWNTDKENNDIIISRTWLEEETSEFKKTVNPQKTDKSGGSDEDGGSVTIVVHNQVRNEFDISQGDDLYFIAPEGVSDLKPATFIWTFQKLNNIILDKDDSGLGDFPRKIQL